MNLYDFKSNFRHLSTITTLINEGKLTKEKMHNDNHTEE